MSSGQVKILHMYSTTKSDQYYYKHKLDNLTKRYRSHLQINNKCKNIGLYRRRKNSIKVFQNWNWAAKIYNLILIPPSLSSCINLNPYPILQPKLNLPPGTLSLLTTPPPTRLCLMNIKDGFWFPRFKNIWYIFLCKIPSRVSRFSR